MAPAAVAVAAGWMVGCGQNAAQYYANKNDAGAHADAGPSVYDGGPMFAVPDAGPDAGMADAGPPDSGMVPLDAGPRDAGAIADAGPADAGPPVDAGQVGHIDHLVIIVLENHTFDNLFSGFPGAESIGTHIPGPDGGFTAPGCPDSLPRDLCHAHSCALTDWNDGGMNGWENTSGNDDDGDHLAWCHYSQTTIPGFWDLATSYSLADNFHASMLGPSFPGHTFLLAAQAGRATDNPDSSSVGSLLPIWGCDDPAGTTVSIDAALGASSCSGTVDPPCFSILSAPSVLPPAVTWKFYGTGIQLSKGDSIVWSMFDAISPIRDGPDWGSNVVTYSPNFEDDLAAGTLPNVSWLVDQDIYSGHPPLSMCASVEWATGYANDIINSPYWKNSAVLITWDDFGGFYNHVPPPSLYGCSLSQPYGEGFRLPLILISPWVKQGVFHGVTEQASVVRLVEELFAPGFVGFLGQNNPDARDGVAGSLLDAFDFSQPPLPAVPGSTTCPAQ